MYIPKFWSSHKLRFTYKNKSTEVFRFGWSDSDVNHAKTHAIARCEAARTRFWQAKSTSNAPMVWLSN